MPKRFALAPDLELDEAASYHQDVEASLRFYFSPADPAVTRLNDQEPGVIGHRLRRRLNETDFRSAFFVLTSLEASLKVDFHARCSKRLKDPLSRYFRQIADDRGAAVRLDEDILQGWKAHTSASPLLIGELRGAFKLRHWLAHGRYWTPKFSRKYDFAYVLLIAEGVITEFQLIS